MGVKNPVPRTPQLASFPPGPAVTQRFWHTGHGEEYIWSGTVWKSTTTGAQGGGGDYACPAEVAIGDVVAVVSSNAVDQARADDDVRSRVLGVVSAKPTSTTCEVVRIGKVSGYSGLTVGEHYYLSATPGQLSAVSPSASGTWSVLVGAASSTGDLEVRVQVRVGN